METRRKIIKGVIGTGLISGALPQSWMKPVVNAVVLPAHAQTSGTTEHPTTGTVSGASSITHETSEDFTVTPSDADGIVSVSFTVSNGDSGTGNSYAAPTTLAPGSYTITWTITGKKSDGTSDTPVTVTHTFEVVCPSFHVPDPFGGCTHGVQFQPHLEGVFQPN